MCRRELRRDSRGNRVVVHAVEDQSRLPAIRKVFVAERILDELVAEAAGSLLAIVIDLEVPGLAPALSFRSRCPAPHKSERRRHQHQPESLRMTRRVERRQIPAQARSHERHSLAAREILDQLELAADRQMLEIASREIRNLERRNAVTKERSLFGGRSGSKAMQVDDAHRAAVSGKRRL